MCAGRTQTIWNLKYRVDPIMVRYGEKKMMKTLWWRWKGREKLNPSSYSTRQSKGDSCLRPALSWDSCPDAHLPIWKNDGRCAVNRRNLQRYGLLCGRQGAAWRWCFGGHFACNCVHDLLSAVAEMAMGMHGQQGHGGQNWWRANPPFLPLHRTTVVDLRISWGYTSTYYAFVFQRNSDSLWDIRKK
jgi:hypothetical protein